MLGAACGGQRAGPQRPCAAGTVSCVANSSRASRPPAAVRTSPLGASDLELERVAAEILRLDPDGTRFAKAIRRSFDMLLDGQHTGRYRWDQLRKTEKAYCGTLIEINIQRELDFADGLLMDYSIAGIDVDCKYSQDFGQWMLPPEALGELCLGLWANDQKGLWSAGLFRVTETVLTSHNRDEKRRLTAAARDSSVRWLYRDAELPDNMLLRLPEADIRAIFEDHPRSGQARLNELLRRAQGVRISRTVVATVTTAEGDYMKRLRYNGGSRSQLRSEGIVILGDYRTHAEIARALHLPIPGAGDSVAVRLVRRKAHHGSAPAAQIEGDEWVVALPTDPVEPAPMLPDAQGRSGGAQQ